MSNKKKEKEELEAQKQFAIALQMIPVDAEKVRVQKPDGSLVWVCPSKIQDGDVIPLNKKGKPSITTPRKTFKKKTSSGLVRQMTTQRQQHLSKDPILVSLANSSQAKDPDVLFHIIQSIAEETSRVDHTRELLDLQGGDSTKLSVRRVQALRQMAELWVKSVSNASSKTIDLDSPVFTALFGLLMTTLKDVMLTTGIRPDEVQTVFSKLATQVENEEWRVRAHRAMKRSGGSD